jgi:hypothetical protein
MVGNSCRISAKTASWMFQSTDFGTVMNHDEPSLCPRPKSYVCPNHFQLFPWDLGITGSAGCLSRHVRTVMNCPLDLACARCCTSHRKTNMNHKRKKQHISVAPRQHDVDSLNSSDGATLLRLRTFVQVLLQRSVACPDSHGLPIGAIRPPGSSDHLRQFWASNMLELYRIVISMYIYICIGIYIYICIGIYYMI